MRRRFDPDIRQLRRPGEERLHAELDARQNHAPAVAPLLVDHRDGRRRAEVEHDHRQRILLRRRGVRDQNIGAERLRLFDGERQTDR